MKRTPEKLSELCDALMLDASYAAAARRIGISVRTVFEWIAQSQKAPDEWTFEWAGVTAPLCDQVRSAIRRNHYIIEARFRSLCTEDFFEEVTFQGKLCYVEDERKVGQDLDWCELIDGHRDHYFRDEYGKRVPLKVRRKVSDATMIKALAAAFPKLYGSNVDHNVTHGGHVLVLGSEKMKPEPKLIEHVPAEDRLAQIRERMMDAATEHLSRSDRVTAPTHPVQKFDALDGEVHDKPQAVSRAQPMPAQQPQPPKTGQPYSPPYARAVPARNGVMTRGSGPDPRIGPNGTAGFNMNAQPRPPRPRRTV
jgi:hypothetical protein